jgi:hypothetical protein
MTTSTIGDSVAQGTTPAHSTAQVFRRHPEIWVALVLWVASNVFVTGISKFATWEGNASYYRIADLCRWDCGWYGTVLESGYDKAPHRDPGDIANWPFHPIFPLTAYPFHNWLKLPLTASLVLASKAALLFGIYGFLLMVGDQADSTTDRFRAGSLVAFNPYLIYAHAGYAEPLYFSLIAFAFCFASRKRWIASGATAALLSATRLVGFLFSLSYAIMCLRDLGWRIPWRRSELNQVIGLLLCPLGAAVFMLYMYHYTGDALVQIHIQTAWGKSPGNPLHILWVCLAGHHWLRVWGAMTVAALMASAWLFKLRRPELGIYLALSILIPLSASYWCIPRYIWWQPSFLFAVHLVLKRHAGWWLIYAVFAGGIASFMILEWFSGHNFVI